MVDPVIVGILGAAVSLVGAGRPSFWYDEAATISASYSRSLGQLWRMLSNVAGALAGLDPADRVRSYYVSKMIAAVAVGLFDAGLNYLWDETVSELRRRVAGYDLGYFYDIAVSSPDRRKQLSTADDLVRVDDVDLLRGIRRLLYGEGYTIRGVQRILKEHGIKSVQALIDDTSSVPSFAMIDSALHEALHEPEEEGSDEPDIDAEDDDEEAIEPPAPVRRAPDIAMPSLRANLTPMPPAAPMAAPRVEVAAGLRKLDTAKLEAVLQDLLACRQLLDSALKDG